MFISHFRTDYGKKISAGNFFSGTLHSINFLIPFSKAIGYIGWKRRSFYD
jgi:hypothetical protein